MPTIINRIPPTGATERARDFLINQLTAYVETLVNAGGGGSPNLDGGAAGTNYGATTAINGGSA